MFKKALQDFLFPFGILNRYSMIPPPVKTIQQILNDLNHGLPSKPWRASSGVRIINGATLEKDALELNSSEGLVVKLFINDETGEIKTYFARYLDIENRENLWPKQ